jgi:hypothetical protein
MHGHAIAYVRLASSPDKVPASGTAAPRTLASSLPHAPGYGNGQGVQHDADAGGGLGSSGVAAET